MSPSTTMLRPARSGLSGYLANALEIWWLRRRRAHIRADIADYERELVNRAKQLEVHRQEDERVSCRLAELGALKHE